MHNISNTNRPPSPPSEPPLIPAWLSELTSKVSKAWQYMSNVTITLTHTRGQLFWKAENLERYITSFLYLPDDLKDIAIKAVYAAQKALGKADLGKVVKIASIGMTSLYSIPSSTYYLYSSSRKAIVAARKGDFEIAVDRALEGMDQVSNIFGGVGSIGAGLEGLGTIPISTWVTVCARISLGIGALCLLKSGLNAWQAWRVEQKVQKMISDGGGIGEVQQYVRSLSPDRVKKYFKTDADSLTVRLDAAAAASLSKQAEALKAVQQRLNGTKWSLIKDTAFYLATFATPLYSMAAAPLVFAIAILWQGLKLNWDGRQASQFEAFLHPAPAA